ncbi:luciferin 4-monooxygenase [Rhipicephalus sanguineus]|uniref:luciferin 4-monooxygenase n=1 Tax=Rhipicephalus sanguineus TaxID=34632 RepID=UPI001893F570|nr:luciferin 4-monooxygenase [Rhipicephalus sanguineus]
MTELSSGIACTAPLLDEKMSVGRPVPYAQVKVADLNTRRALGPYQRGEICVKSPCAFKGYLNKPKDTADAYENGFVRTGDVGYYSADGRIFLCGRLKELIKCMDHQVAPEEIEEVLAADPEVRQVVVAGVPHLEYEEAARAFVVPQRRLEEALTEQQEADRLKELVAVRLSYHKHLHGGVEFLDSIPETEIGKHPRTFLRDAFVQRQKDDTGGHGGVTREEG